MNDIRPFHYRLSRQPAGLRVHFSSNAGVACGECRNISPSGIRAQFDMHLFEGTTGMLALHHPNCTYELPAKVIRVSPDEAGLEFQCDTTQDQRRLSELVELLEIGLHTPDCRR